MHSVREWHHFCELAWLRAPWEPRCLSDVARSSTDVSKIITLVTNRVPMAPHATILSHNEAQHLHEAFYAPPKPQRRHFRPKNLKITKIRKIVKFSLFPCLESYAGVIEYFSFFCPVGGKSSVAPARVSVSLCGLGWCCNGPVRQVFHCG